MKTLYLLVLSGMIFAQPPVQRMVSVANASSVGTTNHKLTKLTGAPSKAVVSGAGDTGGAIGIVNSGGGTTGSATIQEAGQTTCVFDAATTAGHYVQISASVAGDCTDAGASFPTSGQVIGVVLSTNGGGGTYTVDMSLGQASVSSGALPAGSANACQDYLTSSTFGGDATICNLRLTTLPDPSTLTVVPTCTVSGGETCGTPYTYSAQACALSGCGPGAEMTTITNGPDTLTSSNFVTVTPGAVAGSQTCAITRQDGGTTQGVISNSGCGVAVQDKALFANTAIGFGPNPDYSIGFGASHAVFGNYPIGATGVIGWPVPNFAVSNLFTTGDEPTTGDLSAYFGRIDQYAADDTNTPTAYNVEVNYTVTGTHNQARSAVAAYITTIVNTTGTLNHSMWGADIESDNGGTTVTGGDQRAVFALARIEGGSVPDIMAVNGTLNLGGGTLTNAEVFKAQLEGGTSPSARLVAYYVDNSFTASTTVWSFLSDSSAAIGLPITVFGSLVAYASHAEVYCSDCTVTSSIDNTCAGSGTGATATRVNGAWKCAF